MPVLEPTTSGPLSRRSSVNNHEAMAYTQVLPQDDAFQGGCVPVCILEGHTWQLERVLRWS